MEDSIVLPKDIKSLTPKGTALLSNCLYNQYRELLNENIYSYIEDMLDYVNRDYLGSCSESCFVVDDLLKDSTSTCLISAGDCNSAKDNLLSYSKWFLTQAVVNDLPKESLVALKNIIHIIDSYLVVPKKSKLSSVIQAELSDLVKEVELCK